MEMEEEFKSRVVGVDLSSDRTTYAIVDIRGRIIASSYFETDKYPDINDYVSKLTDEIINLVEANGGYGIIRSVGISVPSACDILGRMVSPPNLPWKGNIPLAAMMRDRMGLAVALGNDAYVAALGEQVYGSAHGMKNFIVVALSSGTGSCFFSDGHAHMGFEGFSGELGHVCIENEGRLCGCGSRGCLEAYTGTKGIIYTAQELMANSDEPSLMRDVEHLSPRIIKECCDKGDALAIETFRRTGEYLGLGLANYASLVNPQAVILTGGISHAGKWLLEPTRVSFEKHVFYTMRDRVKILVSKLDGHERDVLGASVLAWEVPEYSLFK